MTDFAAGSAPAAPASLARPTYPFEVKSRDVLRIAVPAAVAFITEPMVGIVDTTVIGRLGDARLLGGVVLGALAFDTLFSLAYFLRLGTAGLTAQAIGARDPKDALMEATRAILVALIIGLALIALAHPVLWIFGRLLAPPPGVDIPFAAYFLVRIYSAPFALINYALLGWFYGRGTARIGMALQILIHGVNIALNIWFVMGLGWGVEGAALGTVLGEASACLVGLGVVLHHFGGPRALLARIAPAELLDAAALRRMFALSRDITIRTVALMVSYAYFAGQGSRAGDVTLAGNAILMNFLMVSSFFLDGLAQASEQLCGKAVGANWPPAFDKAFRLSMAWGVGIGLAIGAAWLLGGRFLIELMTTSAPVRTHADYYLPMAALAAITGMPAFVLDGVLSGATLNTVMRNGMLVALAFFLVAAFVLQPPLGNWGLWLAFHAFFLARAGVFYIGMERRKRSLFTA
jgi:MATE family multidrug resistance protein